MTVVTPHLPILGPNHTLEATALPRSLQAGETKGRHPEKKAAYFWTLSKRGEGGPTQIQKFWGSFFWAFFWTLRRKGEGGWTYSKSFWVVLRKFYVVFFGCFEVVFSCKLFLNLFKQKLPQVCPKRVRGGGQCHFWTMSKSKQLFSRDVFPKA